MNHQIDDSTYQKFLKDLRLLGRSKVDVAERLDINKSNLSNYIKGTVWPGAKTIRKFYEEFGEELKRSEKDRKNAPVENLTDPDVGNEEHSYKTSAPELKKIGESLQNITDLVLSLSQAVATINIKLDQISRQESGK